MWERRELENEMRGRKGVERGRTLKRVLAKG